MDHPSRNITVPCSLSIFHHTSFRGPINEAWNLVAWRNVYQKWLTKSCIIPRQRNDADVRLKRAILIPGCISIEETSFLVMLIRNTCCIHTWSDFSSVRRGGAFWNDYGRRGDRAVRPVDVRLRGGRYRREGANADHQRLDPRGRSQRREGDLHEVSETTCDVCLAVYFNEHRVKLGLFLFVIGELRSTEITHLC